MTTKTIAVGGATGQLGGSVARRMLKEGWHVRALTRNKTSQSAKALAEAGAELVTASYDDVDSLTEAFKGAHAVFGVTNFFDFFMELGDGAAEHEYQQMINIATAANQTKSLEHFILHSLPSGVAMAGFRVPHMDTKDKAASKIKSDFPDLAKITTFLWVGLFVSNFYVYPTFKPVELPGSYGSHVFIQPCSPDTATALSGDIEHNVGSFVNAILKNPRASRGAKIAFVQTEVMPYKDVLALWCEITGKRATFLQCSKEAYEELFGMFGTEMALQFQAMEAQPNWAVGHEHEMIDVNDLGIPKDDLVDTKASLMENKDKL